MTALTPITQTKMALQWLTVGVTVLLFAKQKVVASFAFRAGELDDKAIDAVMKAVPQLFEAK